MGAADVRRRGAEADRGSADLMLGDDDRDAPGGARVHRPAGGEGGSGGADLVPRVPGARPGDSQLPFAHGRVAGRGDGSERAARADDGDDEAFRAGCGWDDTEFPGPGVPDRAPVHVSSRGAGARAGGVWAYFDLKVSILAGAAICRATTSNFAV